MAVVHLFCTVVLVGIGQNWGDCNTFPRAPHSRVPLDGRGCTRQPTARRRPGRASTGRRPKTSAGRSGKPPAACGWHWTPDWEHPPAAAGRPASFPARDGQVRGAMRLNAQSCWSAAAASDAVEPVPAAVGAHADGPVLPSDPRDGLGALCADARVRVEAGRSVSSIGHTSATLSVSLGPTEVVDVAALATGIRGWVGARWAPVDNGSVSGHPPPPTAATRCHGDGPSRWWQRPPAARRHARPRVDGGEAGWLP